MCIFTNEHEKAHVGQLNKSVKYYEWANNYNAANCFAWDYYICQQMFSVLSDGLMRFTVAATNCFGWAYNFLASTFDALEWAQEICSGSCQSF